MPLPVIANVFRVTFNFESNDGPASHNVLHFLAASYNEQDLGVAIDDHRTADMYIPLSSNYICNNYDVLALDGTSAGVNVAAVDPIAGGSTGGAIPGTAAILSLKTLERGPAHRGRIFMGPIGEEACDNGFTDFDKAAWVAAWTTFAETLGGLAAPIGIGVASYAHASFSFLSNITAPNVLGTQKRRQSRIH